MIVTHHYVLVLALCRLAVDVRAAPAAPSSHDVDDTISQTTKRDGVHVGVGIIVPPHVKDDMNMRRDFPIHVAQNNANGFNIVPVQNYENDAKRMPVLGDIHQPGTTQGQD